MIRKTVNQPLLLGAVLVTISYLSFSQTANQATKWKVMEIVLQAEKQYDNPFKEVRITAAFTGPEGTKISTKGFWDGGKTYKVRFTPTREGKWTYLITSNKSDRGLMNRGAFTAGAAPVDQHGFVRKDVAYPYHFVYDDGTRYYMWGTTYYSMVNNALQGDKWKIAIDSARVFGINKFRMGISKKGEKSPYADAHVFMPMANGKLDYERLNPGYWKGVDEIVQYSYNKGMIVDVIVMGTDEETYSTEINEKRYADYIISRYAAYPNLIWTLVNEWNYRLRDYKKDKAYWNMLGEMFKANDPWASNGNYRRLLSIHQQTRVDFQFFDQPWVTHAIVQYGVRNGQATQSDEWDSSDPRVRPNTKFGDRWGNVSITYNLKHNMPVVNDEYGYIGEPGDRSESASTKKEDWPPFTRTKHRQVSWGIAVAGGYGSTGDKNKYNDGSPYFSANWHSEPKEYDDVKHLIAFFTQKGLEYWKMNSANELVTGDRTYALAEPGRQYVVYAAVGGQFTLQVLAGKYTATLFNPSTGEYKSLEEQTGEKVSITLPDNTDWVVYLKS